MSYTLRQPFGCLQFLCHNVLFCLDEYVDDDDNNRNVALEVAPSLVHWSITWWIGPNSWRCHLAWVGQRLRYLSVLCFKFRFKLAMTVYKCLSGLVPAYLAIDCVPISSVASRQHQRSADARKLAVRRTRTILGSRDFAVSSAVIWNSLPVQLRVLVADCCNVC